MEVRSEIKQDGRYIPYTITNTDRLAFPALLGLNHNISSTVLLRSDGRRIWERLVKDSGWEWMSTHDHSTNTVTTGPRAPNKQTNRGA